MGDDDDRGSLPRAARGAARRSPSPVDRVEVAGRLVGEHERRLADERPGDRHPLPLAAGQLRRPVRAAGARARPGRAPARARRRRSRRGPRGRAGRRRRCRRRSAPSSRWNCWKTKPSRARPQRRQLRGPTGADDLGAGDAHRAGGRPVERADHVQQRRLARARRADDRPRTRPSSTRRSIAGEGRHRRVPRIDRSTERSSSAAGGDRRCSVIQPRPRCRLRRRRR